MIAAILLLCGSGQQAIAAEWVVQNLGRDPPTAGGKATAQNGRTYIDIGCNGLLGPGVAATLYGYQGRGFQRIDDANETVVFEITASDKRQTFPTRMHYIESEEAWVLTDWLPEKFLDAFEAGEALTIRNSSGRDVVTFGLSGSANVTAKMREYCGM